MTINWFLVKRRFCRIFSVPSKLEQVYLDLQANWQAHRQLWDEILVKAPSFSICRASFGSKFSNLFSVQLDLVAFTALRRRLYAIFVINFSFHIIQRQIPSSTTFHFILSLFQGIFNGLINQVLLIWFGERERSP